MGDLELQEAITLISEGYSPFPIKGIEKVPLVKFSEVSIDSEEKAREYRWRGIGIHCGRSNVWVLDIDGEEGYAELKELTGKYGDLPETRTVKTGSGGMHYYWDASKDEIRSGVLSENIHIKGNVGNAFVVAPPTLHKSGNRYEYLNRGKPVAAPDWLVKLVLEKTFRKPREPAGYTPGTGSSITDDYGLSCMEIGAPINALQTDQGFQGSHPFHGSTTGTNFAINEKGNIWHCFRCNSGGGALELFAVREGIISCEGAKPGCLDGKYAEVIRALKSEGYRSRSEDEQINDGKQTAENFLESVAMSKEPVEENHDEYNEQLKEAIDDYRVDEKIKAAQITARLPPFPNVPKDIPLFHDYVKVMGEITYSLPEFHFASILPIISMTIGRRAFIEVVTKKIYCNVFVMVAGITTISGKSVACDTAIHGFKKSVEYKDTTGGMPANNTVVETDAFTAPAITQMLSYTPTVLWYYDDCRPFFYDAAGHNKSIIPDLCKIYDGNTTSIKYSMKGKEGQTKYVCKDPYLSCLFNTTIGNIEEVANEKLSENGFFPRFMWFLGEGGHPRKNVRRTDEQKKTIERISAQIKEIADELRTIPEDGVAFQINDNIEQWRLDEDLKYIDNENWHAIIGRGFIHAYKLAVIFTILDKEIRRSLIKQTKYPISVEIPDKYAEAALKLLDDYLIPRALHVATLTINNDMKNRQNLVIKYLKKLGGATGRAELLKITHLTRSELQVALESLGPTGSGEISIEKKRTKGRELEIIILNPS